MAGRKTLCTPETTKGVVAGLIAGLTYKDAAIAAGISERTFYNWLARGEAEKRRVAESNRRRIRKREKPFVQFLQEVKKAHSARKRTLLARILQTARGGEERTETRQTLRRVNGELQVVEERTTVKTAAPNWTAAAWLLERGYPDEFGRRTRLDVHDWREEARKEGYDPDAIFDGLVAEFTAAMVGESSDGSPEGSQEAPGAED